MLFAGVAGQFSRSRVFVSGILLATSGGFNPPFSPSLPPGRREKRGLGE
jgi:hypothetical protein